MGQTPSIIGSLYDDLVACQLPAIDEGAWGLAFVRGTQVAQRSDALQLNAESARTLLRDADLLYCEITEPWPAPETTVQFEGGRTSELTAFLAGKSDVVVTLGPAAIVVDAAIVLQGNGITLDFAGATLDTAGYTGSYVVEIEGRERIRVCNLEVQSLQNNGIFVSESHHVAIANCRFADVAGNPVVVIGATHHFDINGNEFLRTARAAIHVECGPEKGVVRDNVMLNGAGHSNFHAGILLSDRGGHNLHEPQQIAVDGRRLTERTRPPRDIIVVGNTVEAGLSSGIYSDGACRNLILQNRVLRNSKEGICLDNGSTANVVAGNVIEGNGQRYGQSDEQLESEFVLRYGRMEDGTARAKVPGVSIDNAMYNLVLKNTVRGNFGGGVKLVRTAFYNTIALNAIAGNNAGQSDLFHYFGVELGAAIPDEAIAELDFTGSCGNMIAANEISGNHYAGVLFAPGSMLNHVLDNVISDATHTPIESVVPQPNTLNNNTFSPESPALPALPAACGAGAAGASSMILLGFLLVRAVSNRPPRPRVGCERPRSSGSGVTKSPEVLAVLPVPAVARLDGHPPDVHSIYARRARAKSRPNARRRTVVTSFPLALA